MTWRLAAVTLCSAGVVLAQAFSQRGYVEDLTTLFPQTAPNDSAHIVSELLLRWDVSYQLTPWLKLNGSIDGRADSHRQVSREWTVSADDRSLRRPPLALRRFSAIANRGKFTFEAGRQFIRWGRADILNPVDRFAPKDYLNVVNTDFLGVIAGRATYESGANTVDVVWQPWFTPSRTPLLNQRWTVLPETVPAIPIKDVGADYPSRSQFGARWNHVGRGYEAALSYFDGYNHLPLFRAGIQLDGVAVQRYYPRLRLYGFDGALPTRWVTVKAEAAYFTSIRAQTDEYLLYVLQLERQQGAFVFVGGYAGELVTSATANPLQFSPERGLARTFLGRAEYTIGTDKTVAVSGAARQNGRGSWMRGEYSQILGSNWRATAGVTWIHGYENDFLGQYHRNSYASLALRYSF